MLIKEGEDDAPRAGAESPLQPVVRPHWGRFFPTGCGDAFPTAPGYGLRSQARQGQAGGGS